MVFRMVNTSWRGLRFRFVGSLRDAYLTHLPPFVVVLPMVALSFAMPEDPEQAPPDWVLGSIAAVFLLFLLTLPWLMWRIKAYQHRHYALGPLQTDFRATLGSFYALAAKPFLLVAGLLGLLVLAIVLTFGSISVMGGLLTQILWVVPLLVFGFWLLILVGIGPWITTRLQNLVWTKTGNAQMRFISQLRFRDMLWLSLKNGLLIMVTLGLYWPFAKVAMARLRLEAVHVRAVADLQALVAAGHERPAEAAGDAAGDFFGLDVGL